VFTRVRIGLEVEPRSDAQASRIDADKASLCGDFNAWSPESHPMKRRNDGTFSTTLRLQPGREQFRYLLDDNTWINDSNADEHERNEYGSDDSVAIV
jgi:1,4-alpha-glucan branching enzyme